jgi:hypothetical protein
LVMAQSITKKRYYSLLFLPITYYGIYTHVIWPK